MHESKTKTTDGRVVRSPLSDNPVPNYIQIIRFLSMVTNLGIALGPVVRRPISANPGLNFNPGFFFF